MQRVTDAYAYNAWGEDVGQLRGSADAAKPENPYRYVGKSGYYSDNDTGLILLGARYYDPLLGRFITQDPARDGLNWYAYCGNNPVGAVDPSGLNRLPTQQQEWGQYVKVVEMLMYEDRYGTWATARNYSNTFGRALGTPMGPDFDGVAVTSAAGSLDLDWYFDMVITKANKYTVDFIYSNSKTLWNAIRPKDPNNEEPYGDPHEVNAIACIKGGYTHLRDIYPKEFMDSWFDRLCPDPKRTSYSPPYWDRYGHLHSGTPIKKR